jgi:F-type H+-transporting ATPase subunit delta
LRDSRLSKRYARALFSIGQEDGSFSQYGQELEEFVRFYTDNEHFAHAVSSSIFATEDKKNLLQAVLDRSDFSIVVINFLNLLVDRNRIEIIEAITEYYTILTDDASNISKAEIITAKPLNKKMLKKINMSIEGLTSKTIKPEIREDQSLIGGIVVKIGDLVLDGSVKAQLEGLKESFKRGE